MSPRRHTPASYVGLMAACALLLSGCFGSGGQAPSAHPSRSHPTQASEPTTGPTSASMSPTSSPSVLSFDPEPGGKHQKDCEKLQPGDDPAEFLYYPVVITPSSAITLDEVTTQHSVGVFEAGAWVAPTGPTPETGTFKGWPPPSIVTGDPNLRWAERVPAKGAHLEAGVAYNVFLRLQVDPTPGDSRVRAIDFSLAGDTSTTAVSVPVSWPADTTFSMSC